MNRMRLDHMEWSKGTLGMAAIDLADSAISAPDLAALGLPHTAQLPSSGLALVHQLERALGVRLAAPGGRVQVVAGASEAIAVVFGALLDPGDEVLVETPGYQPHAEVPKLFGATVRTFARSRGQGYAGWASAIEEQLGSATRLVVLSDLHNPSGAMATTADLDALGVLAQARGFHVLVDETFRDAGPAPTGTIAVRGPQWVSISSLTKAYGLGGLRIGWIAAHADVLLRCFECHDGLSVQPSHLSVALALELIPHLDALRARTHRLLAANHIHWAQFIARVGAALERAGMPLQRGVAPCGTTTFAAFGREGLGDAFARHAFERYDVAVTPGRFFGDAAGFRVGLGVEAAQLDAGIERLERAAREFPTTLTAREAIA